MTAACHTDPASSQCDPTPTLTFILRYVQNLVYSLWEAHAVLVTN